MIDNRIPLSWRLSWTHLSLRLHCLLAPSSSFSSSLFYSLCCAQVGVYSTTERQQVADTLPAHYQFLTWMGYQQQGQTWTSWRSPVLSSSSFFFMSVSQLSSSFMKLSISSAFWRIWSCNSIALFPPDMLFPVRHTFVLDNFLTPFAVFFLEVGVAAKWKTRESRRHAFAAS